MRFGFTFKDRLAVSVQFWPRYGHLARVNAHTTSRTVSSLPLHSFSVDGISLPVNLDDLANLLPFLLSSHNLNFTILSDGLGSNIVLLSQLFRKRRKHHLPVNVGRRIAVPFMVLALVRSRKGIELRLYCWRLSNGLIGEEL